LVSPATRLRSESQSRCHQCPPRNTRPSRSPRTPSRTPCRDRLKARWWRGLFAAAVRPDSLDVAPGTRVFGNEGRLPGTDDTVKDDTRARVRSRRTPQRSSGCHCVRCARGDSGSAAHADRPALCEVTVWRASVQPLTGQLLRLLQNGATSHQSRRRLAAVSSANTRSRLGDADNA
jgi:hypothetical protein